MAATLEVRAPASTTFLRFIFSNRQVSGTEELKMVCVTLRELTLTFNISGVTGKNYLVTKNLSINTRQSSYTYTLTLAHTIIGD